MAEQFRFPVDMNYLGFWLSGKCNVGVGFE
jgi:hypothetical protein